MDIYTGKPMTHTNAKLASALAKAQAELENATLNKINPHFKSKYADLAGIRNATAPILAKHGISVVQFTDMRDGAFFLFTRLLHESGEFMESMYPLPLATDKPQVMGSALTYARRYSWSAMCGISADEDDDANAAQRGGQSKPAPKVNDKQKSEIVGLLQETGADTKVFLAHFKVSAVDEMTVPIYEIAKAMLQKKKDAGGKDAAGK